MKYVVECYKKVKRLKVGLGPSGWYLPGQYITYEGDPTRDFCKAFIYDDKVLGENFLFEEPMGDGTNLGEFFRRVPVEIKVKRSVQRKKTSR